MQLCAAAAGKGGYVESACFVERQKEHYKMSESNSPAGKCLAHCKDYEDNRKKTKIMSWLYKVLQSPEHQYQEIKELLMAECRNSLTFVVGLGLALSL